MAAITITSKKYLKFFFTLVPFISAAISTIHLLNLFDLGNANWLSILLSIAFEIGSISAFLMMSEFKQRHTFLKWFIFLILFFMQIIGNIYYSFEFINISLKENPLFLESFTELANVFIMMFREDPLTTSGSKFLLSCLVGLPVPIISLAFLKARMNLDIINEEENLKIQKEENILIPVNDITTHQQIVDDIFDRKEEDSTNIVQVIDEKDNNILEEGVITTTTPNPNDYPLIIDMLKRELSNTEKPKKAKKKVVPNKKKKVTTKKNKIEVIPEEESLPIIEKEEKKVEIKEEEEKKEKVEEEILQPPVVLQKEKQIVNIPEQTLEEKKQEENLLMMTTISTPNLAKKKNVNKPSTNNKKTNSKKVIVETLDLDDDFKVPHINN